MTTKTIGDTEILYPVWEVKNCTIPLSHPGYNIDNEYVFATTDPENYCLSDISCAQYYHETTGQLPSINICTANNQPFTYSGCELNECTVPSTIISSPSLQGNLLDHSLISDIIYQRCLHQ